MKISKYCFLAVAAIILFAGCKKECPNCAVNTTPHLVFKFVFDSTQQRLDNFGNNAPMPAGHAGQSPLMNVMSAHYIELAPTGLTALGSGTILYSTPMTSTGGSPAIDFSQEHLTANNGIFYSVALDSVTPGTYQYLRVSLAYQNYSVNMFVNDTVDTLGYSIPVVQQFPCTIASFVGVKTYVTTYTVKTENISPDSNVLQGYWGFEAKGTYNVPFYGQNYPYQYNFVESGETAAGATTVVNPISATSPIPPGSCVETGAFVTGLTATTGTPLVIPAHGTATQDIVITVSLSVNKSFEWVEVVQDGLWQPEKGENIVNMGIRGLVPIVGQ